MEKEQAIEKLKELFATETCTSYRLPEKDKRTKWERIKDAFNNLMVEIFN